MQELPHTFVHKYSAVLHYVCVPAAVEAGSWYSMSTLKARTFTNLWQFWAKDKAGANWGFLFIATEVTFLGNYFVFKFVWLREQTRGEGLRVNLKVQFNENSYRSFNLSTARLVNKMSASSRSHSVCFYVRALSNTLPHLHHFVINLTKGKQTSSRLISPDPPSWSSAEQNSHAFCLPAARLRLWVDGSVVIQYIHQDWNVTGSTRPSHCFYFEKDPLPIRWMPGEAPAPPSARVVIRRWMDPSGSCGSH